ncbi:hypothetical protein Bra3105_16485 [Brachybacterium halotolerans subsp. kimchii]|uniref:hypothetical protein n=1 Tax=Brachybacterium halotolerans TaxID=2795215 RepID=UPI001E330664|nr:hypothetical protein [Brachybacterium halotolerans]UEJ82412.1 hypothetical protein Bra3105_16485 [Brachybacterium halotolerans subsp. kimchii]
MTDAAEEIVLVVDGANVVGSVPDGWWRDRARAAVRLRDRLEGLEIPVEGLEIPAEPAGTIRPLVALVVEGKARDIPEIGAVRVVRAPGSGDDEIVAEVERRVADGSTVLAVTNDRELRARIEAAGGEVRRVGWLRGMLDARDQDPRD